MPYAHPESLVETEWLAAHLDDPDIRVVDASFKLPGITPMAREDYDRGHIPGAVFFDVDAVSDHENPLPHMFPSADQFGRDVGALGIEFANARRQHEYAALKQHKFPDNMILIPGVIDSKINLVEHPEVVAQRIETAVAAVGDRERVIASSDCGFGTFAGWEWVAEDVAWAKLKSLSEGAAIASKRLWG